MTRLVLALLLVWTTSAEAAVLWFTGVETGDVSEWGPKSGVGSTFTVDATNVKSGGYKLQADAASAIVLRTPTALSFGVDTLYARFAFAWATTFTGDQLVWQFMNAADTKHIDLQIQQSTKTLCWGRNSGAIIACGSTVLVDGTYVLVELKVVASATVGGMELKVNGNTEFTALSTDTSDVSIFDHAYFGPGFGGAAIVARIDDVMICSTAYCPPGISIARQGTSGSPAYTAWTKNSCTSSLIENCWSATPFVDGTPNASNSVADDAQTMLVHSFSTTQAGHGSEMFTGLAINACKTAMIAKTASSSGASLRRRLAGVDTDSIVTLTTSNAYYDDGIWTDTLANLNAAEIGVVHGSGANLDTVQDMWLICDGSASIGATSRHKVRQN